jgi:hypothetical protein
VVQPKSKYIASKISCARHLANPSGGSFAFYAKSFAVVTFPGRSLEWIIGWRVKETGPDNQGPETDLRLVSNNRRLRLSHTVRI